MGIHRPKVLFMGLTWPEPEATAAGVRTVQIIKALSNLGYEVTFSSASDNTTFKIPQEIENISFIPVRLNHESFNVFLKSLEPGIVIFDRFLTEEYFGWRVAQTLPNALRILDTQDLHSLRQSREIAFKKGISFSPEFWKTQDITKRELASIFRSDLSLIISKFEIDWLLHHTPVEPSLLYYLPFFFARKDLHPEEESLSYGQRKNYVFIGNGRHTPNLDAIRFIKNEILPRIRKELPNARGHIYGAYLPREITALHAPEEGFFVKGHISDAGKILRSARVNLVPLRFGAGLKGKLFQASLNGTPSVMTPVAAEGTAFARIKEVLGTTPDELASRAIALYKDKNLWNGVQKSTIAILKADFNAEEYADQFGRVFTELEERLDKRRAENIIGGMLMHHTVASSRYLSKWISLKEEKTKKDTV